MSRSTEESLLLEGEASASASLGTNEIVSESEHVAAPAHAQVAKHHVESGGGIYVEGGWGAEGAAVGRVGATHAVTVIIVVCVGFLLFMIVLGVIRIRAAHARGTQEEMQDAEMAWDDSALNITVNPMEVCNK
jgi:hypothetical protein